MARADDGPVRLGPYELDERLGAGGMAEVWRAHRHGAGGFEWFVAVKRMLPHLTTEKMFVDQFLKEARIAKTLRHPNVVKVEDFGEADGGYYLVMELVAGRDLAHVADRARQHGAPLSDKASLPLVLYVVSETLRGLSYAHTSMSHVV